MGKSQSLSRMSSRKRDDKGAQRRASASPTPSPKQKTYPSTAFTAPRVTSTSPEREGGRTAASTSQLEVKGVAEFPQIDSLFELWGPALDPQHLAEMSPRLCDRVVQNAM